MEIRMKEVNWMKSFAQMRHVVGRKSLLSDEGKKMGKILEMENTWRESRYIEIKVRHYFLFMFWPSKISDVSWKIEIFVHIYILLSI